jgi:hypothetical protein
MWEDAIQRLELVERSTLPSQHPIAAIKTCPQEHSAKGQGFWDEPRRDQGNADGEDA